VIVVSHDIEPFVARAARALALHGGRLTCYETLPEDLGERLALLDRLARGVGAED
jgi:Arc/MetJ family transcription regulator